MPWFSILPEGISFIETWAIRFFIVLGILTIGPWILLLVYDLVLFLFRVILYDLPIIGGRARNRPRPRAPSLRNRPSGRPRSANLSLPGVISAPTTPILKAAIAATGLEERHGNIKVVQRSRKVDVHTDLPKETAEKLQTFFEENSWEAVEQLDKTAIAQETGLTTNQVRDWFTDAHRRQKGKTGWAVTSQSEVNAALES